MGKVTNLPSSPHGLSHELLSKLQVLIDLIKSDRRRDEIPGVLIGHLVDLFDLERADFYVAEASNSEFRLAVSFPEDTEQEGVSRKTPRAWASERQTIWRAIEQKAIVFNRAPPAVESWDGDVSAGGAGQVAVPIMGRGPFELDETAVVAVVVMSRRDGSEFFREEYELLNITSSLIGTAYNNSYAKSLQEKRINFLSSILSAQTGDLDIVFNNFFIAINKLVPSKFLALWLYNELDNKLVIRSLYPPTIGGAEVSLDSLDRLVMDCDSCLSGEVIKSKHPKVFTRIAASDKFGNPNFAKQHDLDWFISVPILDVNEKPLGLVNITPLGKPEEFSQEALEALSRYIAPLSNTIRLASLLNEESLLFAFDDFFQNMLDFQDQQGSWDSLAVLIRRQMRCAACSIFLIEARPGPPPRAEPPAPFVYLLV